MAEFIRTAEVIGQVAQKIYNIGKFTTHFVAERLFTPGGWVPPNLDEYIKQVSDESNLERGTE